MFTRDWLRAVLGAGGVLLVVPFGLVLASVLTVAFGGTGLHGLGQVVGGPQVPVVDAARGAPAGRSGDGLALPGLPARAGRAFRSQAGAGAGTGAGAAPAASGRNAQRTRVAPSPRAPVRRQRPAPATPAPGRAPLAPVSPSAPTPPPAPVPPSAPAEPVQRVGDAIDGTLRPVAPRVADAAGSVVDLLAPPR